MSKHPSPKNKYGLKELMHGSDEIQPSALHLNRRRLAKALQNIASHIVRMDVTDEDLSAYVREFVTLEKKLGRHGKLDGPGMYKKMTMNQASADEVLMGHDYSILNGKASAVAFPMELKIEHERVVGHARVPLPFQGPPQRVHGGIVAAIFDILLARTQYISGFIGYTASLKVDYRLATPLDTELQLVAWVEKVAGRKMYNKAEITANGKVCAVAEGLWIKPKVAIF